MFGKITAFAGFSIALSFFAACEGSASASSARVDAGLPAQTDSTMSARAGPGMPSPPDPATLARQAGAFVEALQPARPGRLVVAVLAFNEGTEMTDLLLPHALLMRADVAEVRIVAPRAGRVDLYPALRIDGAQALADFDRAHPSGADYVIVPAMSRDDNPEIIAWLRRQAGGGARIIGVDLGLP